MTQQKDLTSYVVSVIVLIGVFLFGSLYYTYPQREVTWIGYAEIKQIKNKSPEVKKMIEEALIDNKIIRSEYLQIFTQIQKEWVLGGVQNETD